MNMAYQMQHWLHMQAYRLLCRRRLQYDNCMLLSGVDTQQHHLMLRSNTSALLALVRSLPPSDPAWKSGIAKIRQL